MNKEYIPGSLVKTLLGEKVKKFDDKLDALFKNSVSYIIINLNIYKKFFLYIY
jgi:hypothetical protein